MKAAPKTFSYVLILVAFSTISCNNLSVDFAKRKYRPGYYLSISSNKKPDKISKSSLATSSNENILVSEKNKIQKYELLEKKEDSSRNKKNVLSANDEKVLPSKLSSKKLREIVYTTPSTEKKEDAVKTKNQHAKNFKVPGDPNRSNNIFCIMAALTALGSVGLITHQRGRAIKISKWSRNNPVTARTVQAMLHSILGLGSFIGGSMLFDNGVIANSNALDLFTTIFIAAVALYPFKKNNRDVFKTNYSRHKLNGIAIIISSLMMCAVAGNKITNERYSVSTERLSSYKPVQNFFNDVSVKASNLNLFDEYQHKPEKDSSLLWLKILLTILTIVAAIILTVLLAALACSLSCQGNEGMAVLVLVGGLAFLIGLTVLAARGIKNLDKPKTFGG